MRRDESSRYSPTSLWLAVLAFLLALVFGVIDLLTIALKCGENCQDTGWRANDDAWQWDAFAVGSVFSLVLALSFLVLVARRAKRLSMLALALYLLIQVGILVAAHPRSWTYVSESWLLLAAFLVASIGAVFLLPPREEPAPGPPL